MRARAAPAELPVSISSGVFTASGNKYELLRFDEGKGPTLSESNQIANLRRREMLTSNDLEKIMENRGSNIVFRYALKPEEYGYVRDKELEKQDMAILFAQVFNSKAKFSTSFDIEEAMSPNYKANMLILKAGRSFTAAPHTQATEWLRRIRGEISNFMYPARWNGDWYEDQ